MGTNLNGISLWTREQTEIAYKLNVKWNQEVWGKEKDRDFRAVIVIILIEDRGKQINRHLRWNVLEHVVVKSIFMETNILTSISQHTWHIMPETLFYCFGKNKLFVYKMHSVNSDWAYFELSFFLSFVHFFFLFFFLYVQNLQTNFCFCYFCHNSCNFPILVLLRMSCLYICIK